MKKKRQELILKFIKDTNVSTQEEIIAMLAENGYNVTQATISRDIKELKLIKEHYGRNETRYAISEKSESDENLIMLFSRAAYSVNVAMNIVVVKCYPGTANAACAALDGLKLSGVLGSIAGDDTIFTVCKDIDSTSFVLKEINDMLKG